MYIPKQMLMNDRPEAIAFMKQFSFATIVSVKDNYQTATHLPFVVAEREGNIVLTSHFAHANPQWKEITNHQLLVIFAEPHAYISPSHYDNGQNVPTWNYVAVHAYGKATLIEDEAIAFSTLEGMIDSFEEAYKKQWQTLSTDYKKRMIKGIVAFEIVVTDLQGKKKLSQNKSQTERARIIEAFSDSEHSHEQQMAKFMAQNE